MADALVFDVPVELGLEVVLFFRPHLSDAEREALDDMVDEEDGIRLGVPVVGLERPDAGGIVDSGVLVSFDGLPVFSTEERELDVDLNLMARNLLPIAGGVNLAYPSAGGSGHRA